MQRLAPWQALHVLFRHTDSGAKPHATHPFRQHVLRTVLRRHGHDDDRDGGEILANYNRSQGT